MVDGVLPAWCQVDRILSERIQRSGGDQVHEGSAAHLPITYEIEMAARCRLQAGGHALPGTPQTPKTAQLQLRSNHARVYMC